jgi:hypothetical protein
MSSSRHTRAKFRGKWLLYVEAARLNTVNPRFRRGCAAHNYPSIFKRASRPRYSLPSRMFSVPWKWQMSSSQVMRLRGLALRTQLVRRLRMRRGTRCGAWRRRLEMPSGLKSAALKIRVLRLRRSAAQALRRLASGQQEAGTASPHGVRFCCLSLSCCLLIGLGRWSRPVGRRL